MSRLGRFTQAAVVGVGVLAIGCAAEEAATPETPAAVEEMAVVPDAVTAAPGIYSTMHEDERVRVVEMKMSAGATDGFHQHPHEVVYFLAGGSLTVELPEGEPLSVELPAGAVLSNEPWSHTVTNVGETDVHAILVEMVQEPGGREAVAEGTDAVSVAPAIYSVLNEDERARVLEMRLPAGAEDGEHTHPDELVYFITGGTVVITTAEGEMEMEIPEGHVLSHEGWTHSVRNVGESEIHAIIWELR
jgi:quercetin dioxygenase-like cupin family protein